MGAQEILTIPAIYEGGVLRPLEPLDLPEHTRVNAILKVAENTTDISDEEFDSLFASAGVPFVNMTADGLRMLTEEERDVLGRRIPPGRPLSEIIIEERESGW